METASGSGPQRPGVIISYSVKYRSVRILLLLLTLCYVLQVFTPLRLNNDAIALLSMGESAARGGGFLDDGQKTVFPSGYPALLAVLLKAGFAHPWVIVGLNMVFLSTGLFAAYILLTREFFEDKAVVLLICSFFLLSYVVVKHSTLPLSDVPFFCCSMCCLAVMSRARGIDSNWRFIVLVGIAGLLALAAMTVRTIGGALFPALVFMIASSPQSASLLKVLPVRTKLIVAAAGALVGGGATLLLARTPYWGYFVGGVQKRSVSAWMLHILSSWLAHLGELFGNFPISKLPTKLHVIVPWMGSLLFLLLLLGLATKRKKVSPTEVFMVCYMGAVFLYPFSDARYWLPVIPLQIAYVIFATKSLRCPKALITMYCIVYATLGLGVIAYSTRITFAGSRFPDRYGDGNLRPTYCAAFQSCRDSGDSSRVDAKVLRLLQEYK
jgi:hypothetical protein